MRHELSTLELVRLAKELGAVTDYYIDQIYQLGEKKFRMKLSTKGDKANLNIEVPDYIAISKMGEISEEASGFAMAMRKRISGMRITSIGLCNSDRILKLSLERKDMKANLILELFGRGNLIITNENMEIDLALQSHEFADRSVKRGAIYKTPRNDSIDLSDEAGINAVFEQIGKAEGNDKLVSYLSRKIGMGALYIEDAIIRQGLDPKVKIKAVEKMALEKIHKRVLEIINSKGSAILYLKGGIPQDASIVELEKYKELEKKEMPLGEAIELLYYSNPKVEKVDNSEVEKIEASLQKQGEIILQMQKDEIACRKTGEFISSNITGITELIKHAGVKKTTLEDLNKMAKGIKVKKLDRAKRALIIEKED